MFWRRWPITIFASVNTEILQIECGLSVENMFNAHKLYSHFAPSSACLMAFPCKWLITWTNISGTGEVNQAGVIYGVNVFLRQSH